MARRMFRSRFDGQLGELVVREGKEQIRLDRPNEEILKPYSPDAWIPEQEERPLARAQIAKVAYEADRALAMALGDYGAARKEWASLKDDDRIAFIEKGPAKGEERRRLWRVLMKHFGQGLS